jgi:hypothetical protein
VRCRRLGLGQLHFSLGVCYWDCEGGVLTDKPRRLDSSHDEQSEGYTRVEDTPRKPVKDSSGRIQRQTERGGRVKITLAMSVIHHIPVLVGTHDDSGCCRGIRLGFTVLIQDIAHALAGLPYRSVHLLSAKNTLYPRLDRRGGTVQFL